MSNAPPANAAPTGRGQVPPGARIKETCETRLRCGDRCLHRTVPNPNWKIPASRVSIPVNLFTHDSQGGVAVDDKAARHAAPKKGVGGVLFGNSGDQGDYIRSPQIVKAKCDRA